VPLCRAHHREVHRAEIELNWWKTAGIDAIDIARELWSETHPLRNLASTTHADIAAPTGGTVDEREVPDPSPPESTKEAECETKLDAGI